MIASPSKMLIDPIGRIIQKLRVSLTDACNFRCFYCMPENAQFLPSSQLLSPQEIEEICSNLVSHGVKEIRITGGEATVRQEFDDIVSRLSTLPLSRLGLTTNGLQLHHKFDVLQQTGCTNINISLDSLKEEQFHRITRREGFKRVINNIHQAKNRGFNIKINTILFRGINDGEVEDFIAFSASHKIPVRFLELIRIGPFNRKHKNLFISAEEVIDRISLTQELIPMDVAQDSTSFMYHTPEGAEIGFIASESRPFCGNCSRLRLSATGKLLACLMSNKGVNLRGLPAEAYSSALKSVMAMKPTDRIESYNTAMNAIGG